MAVNLNAPRHLVGELIYGRGRIVHSFWMNLRGGGYVIDDFGNSVHVENAPILNFIRQEA